eukprot:8893293-Alexandrium_andersonii.AAC.1
MRHVGNQRFLERLVLGGAGHWKSYPGRHFSNVRAGRSRSAKAPAILPEPAKCSTHSNSGIAAPDRTAT